MNWVLKAPMLKG